MAPNHFTKPYHQQQGYFKHIRNNIGIALTAAIILHRAAVNVIRVTRPARCITRGMNSLIWFLAGTSAIAAIIHLTSIVLTLLKLRTKPVREFSQGMPPVSVVRPVCGLDADAETTLRSTFHLNYPDYEIVFCVASPNDPVIPLIRRLIGEYSAARAQLLYPATISSARTQS